jgi:hypothetical protein
MWARRRNAVILAGLLVACSENAPAVRPAEDSGYSAECAGAPCDGSCRDGRCLVELASVASPAHVAIDQSVAYFTICSSDGAGAAASVGVEGVAPPLVLSTGRRCPGGAALGANAFYVGGFDTNDVTRIPLGGGPTSVLALLPGAPIGVAVDDTNVYASTESGTLTALPLDGGAPIDLVSGERSMTAPAVDAADVYFGAPIGGTVKKVPRVGGAVTTLTTIDTVAALALSETDVYLAAGYLVAVLPKTGGQPTTLGTAAGADVVAIAIDEASVYFASYGNVWKIPRNGGRAVQIAGGQTDVTSIAVDGNSVYFTNKVHSPSDPNACCGSVVKVTPK